MVGVPPFQPVKHIVNGIFEALIIFPDFHAVNHFHKGIHVPFFLRPLKDDIGNQRTVKKGFRFCPELVPVFAVPFGVGNQGGHKFQHVTFRLDVGQWIVMHGFGKVDSVEHPEPVALSLQETPALFEGAAFWIYDHIGRMGLKELRGQPESCFSGAGRADHTGV